MANGSSSSSGSVSNSTSSGFMSNSGASETTTTISGVKLPSSLAFLVSNFHSFVTVKLDSGNYIPWRTQLENALRANDLLGHGSTNLEVTVRLPRETRQMPNFIHTKFSTVSTLKATIAVSTLPYVLGKFDSLRTSGRTRPGPPIKFDEWIKGGKGQKAESQDVACQICCKTNHIVRDFYHRLNLQYQCSVFTVHSKAEIAGFQFQQPSQAFLAHSFSGQPQQFPRTFPAQMFPAQSYSATPFVSYQPTQAFSTSPASSNWYFYSGATSHVTNDISNLSLQPSSSSSSSSSCPNDVLVGNGTTLPAANSG
ncbi:hypothetical protein Acr_00g0089270 [Actinidia rufa]|uniref:Retrotransposon Copia-like N-terminal domain-containing protein n=1 Tax=Actinidia rufa TaxID=165716 RepID=A0A7J0DX88_9ERIC|nr:hypothetical protein Acr_00g0089270 [Actinidia rufa]